MSIYETWSLIGVWVYNFLTFGLLTVAFWQLSLLLVAKVKIEVNARRPMYKPKEMGGYLLHIVEVKVVNTGRTAITFTGISFLFGKHKLDANNELVKYITAQDEMIKMLADCFIVGNKAYNRGESINVGLTRESLYNYAREHNALEKKLKVRVHTAEGKIFKKTVKTKYSDLRDVCETDLLK